MIEIANRAESYPRFENLPSRGLPRGVAFGRVVRELAGVKQQKALVRVTVGVAQAGLLVAEKAKTPARHQERQAQMKRTRRRLCVSVGEVNEANSAKWA